MSKEMEKLVEEIWADMKIIVQGGYGQSPRKERVAQLITRIGNAVLSGECPDLDKLLGVVGRAYTDEDINEMDIVSVFRDYGRLPLIALRQKDRRDHG